MKSVSGLSVLLSLATLCIVACDQTSEVRSEKSRIQLPSSLVDDVIEAELTRLKNESGISETEFELLRLFLSESESVFEPGTDGYKASKLPRSRHIASIVFVMVNRTDGPRSEQLRSIQKSYPRLHLSISRVAVPPGGRWHEFAIVTDIIITPDSSVGNTVLFAKNSEQQTWERIHEP